MKHHQKLQERQKQYNTIGSDANNKVYSLKREDTLSFYRSVEDTEATTRESIPSSTIYQHQQKLLNNHNCMCSLSVSRYDHRSEKHKRSIG